MVVSSQFCCTLFVLNICLLLYRLYLWRFPADFRSKMAGLTAFSAYTAQSGGITMWGMVSKELNVNDVCNTYRDIGNDKGAFRPHRSSRFFFLANISRPEHYINVKFSVHTKIDLRFLLKKWANRSIKVTGVFRKKNSPACRFLLPVPDGSIFVLLCLPLLMMYSHHNLWRLRNVQTILWWTKSENSPVTFRATSV